MFQSSGLACYNCLLGRSWLALEALLLWAVYYRHIYASLQKLADYYYRGYRITSPQYTRYTNRQWVPWYVL
ncbi:hypothetical protein GGR58DRAFT_493134 [Xylaria digitata]|nr:hypothetical protein GGR58DRAFT_493134 [Xylaria digitata]